MLGTPDYMAPEIILGKEHSYAVDWWALGIIGYELITGALPFHDTESVQKVFDNILQMNIKWPKVGTSENDLSPDAYDFLSRLITFDPEKRLGSNGVEEVKKHPFFKDIDWDTIRDEGAPWVPQVRNDMDISNFRQDKT